ncbi:hypothetical protein TNCV_4032521 [Trichonephila clavipes]|nr:hypothetical protein TNCV_4032521 [Trichonephila clavipes]
MPLKRIRQRKHEWLLANWSQNGGSLWLLAIEVGSHLLPPCSLEADQVKGGLASESSLKWRSNTWDIIQQEPGLEYSCGPMIRLSSDSKHSQSPQLNH